MSWVGVYQAFLDGFFDLFNLDLTEPFDFE